MAAPAGYWRFDHQNTGSTSDPGPSTEPRIRWEYDAGYTVSSTPVVADGTVHVTTAAPAGQRPGLHGVDASSGERVYATAPKDPFSELRGSPAYSNGVAYVTTYDDAPLVRGYDTRSGSRVRTLDVGRLGTDGIPPLVLDDALVTVSDYVLALCDRSGTEERWRFEAGERFYGAPALHDDRLVVGSTALDTDGTVETGDPDWPKADPQHPSLRALRLTSGEIEWTVSLECVPRTVAVADGVAIVAGTEPWQRYVVFEDAVGVSDGGLPSFGAVQAVSLDGESLWSVRSETQIRCAPAISSGTVVVGTDGSDQSAGGHLQAHDLATGELVWQRSGGERWTGVSIGAGTVYAANDAGFVEARSLADGRRRWRFRLPEAVLAAPSIWKDCLLVADQGGRVYRLE